MAVEFIRHAHPEDNAGHEQRPRVFKAQTTLPPTRTPQGQQVRSSRWRHYDNRLRPPEALDEFILAHVLERGEPGDFFFRQAHLTRPATAGGATFTFIKNWHARRLSEPEFWQNEFWNPQPAPQARHICRNVIQQILQAPSGATSDYAALTELVRDWKRMLQRCRAYGA
jgi:hypothetical protein